VVLDNAIQVYQLAVDVVEHLDLCRRAEEIQRRAAAENLDVALMGREQGNQLIGQAALTAEPGNDG